MTGTESLPVPVLRSMLDINVPLYISYNYNIHFLKKRGIPTIIQQSNIHLQNKAKITGIESEIKIRKKNGDAPGPLGDFVMWLVTERTKKKKKIK